MPGRQCPWCSAPVPDGATNCPGCQAALVDATAGMAIPGVTAVDPQLIAEGAATHRQLERARHPAPGGAVIGLMGGGLLGALVAGAVQSAANSRTADFDAGPKPWDPTELRALDAKLGAEPSQVTGTVQPKAEPDPWRADPAETGPTPWGTLELQALDARPAAEPNQLAGTVEPNVVHWPGVADPAETTQPMERSGPAAPEPPPWGPLLK